MLKAWMHRTCLWHRFHQYMGISLYTAVNCLEYISGQSHGTSRCQSNSYYLLYL